MGNLREIFDKHLPFEEAFVHGHLKHIAGDVGVFIWNFFSISEYTSVYLEQFFSNLLIGAGWGFTQY